MQSNEPQESRFKVQMGDDIGSNEVSCVKIDITLSKQATADKIAEVKNRISGDLNMTKGAVFVLPTQSPDALESVVTRLFTDKKCSEPSKTFTKAVNDGKLAYKIFRGTNQIFLAVYPGEAIDQMVTQQAQMATMMGAGQLVDNNKTQFSLSYKSLRDFTQLEEDLKSGTSFLRAITKSLALELDVTFNPSVIDQLLTLASTFKPGLMESPVQLARVFLSIGLDLKFKSSDDLPDTVKEKLNTNTKVFKHGIALPPQVKEYERPFLRELLGLIDNGLEIITFFEDIANVHIHGNIPGFGAHFVRNIQEGKEE